MGNKAGGNTTHRRATLGRYHTRHLVPTSVATSQRGKTSFTGNRVGVRPTNAGICRPTNAVTSRRNNVPTLCSRRGKEIRMMNYHAKTAKKDTNKQDHDDGGQGTMTITIR